jgi:hypothetical protein
MSQDAIALNSALKKEIDTNQPHIWQARASVELVHDLNNPLTVVIGYSALMVEEAHKLAQHDPELGKRMADYAVIVEKAAEYCHHLSENWRTASKKTAEFALIDVVAVAQEVKNVIFFGSPAVQITGRPDAWIKGSKYEVMRIFQNLREAGGGRFRRERGQADRDGGRRRPGHGRGPHPPGHARWVHEQGEWDRAGPEHLPAPDGRARRELLDRVQTRGRDQGPPRFSRGNQGMTDPSTYNRAWVTPK